jgi:hypothetical protein
MDRTEGQQPKDKCSSQENVAVVLLAQLGRLQARTTYSTGGTSLLRATQNGFASMSEQGDLLPVSVTFLWCLY